MKQHASMLGSVLVAAVALGLSGNAQAPVAAVGGFVPNEVLVQFRPGATPADRAGARGRVNAVAQEVIVSAGRRADGKGDLELVRVPPGLAIAEAVRGLRGDASVEFAEPNWIYQHQDASNDPLFLNGSLWGVYGAATVPANQWGSHAAAAWARGNTGDSTVYVGVIDEGIMATHEDLGVNVFTNLNDPVNGRDDDGNGFVDDVRGWDFAGNNNSTYDGTQDDHGTHVAGTIGAIGGNGRGVAGVSWRVKMIPAKFLGRNGGTTANAIKAVNYITAFKRAGYNVVATNNSWGGGGFSQALLDAIKEGGNAGILFIAAAGNGGRDGVGDNNDLAPHYPANYVCSAAGGFDCVISVAAITSTGAKSGFSNYGPNSVDLGAPGSAIVSTIPGTNQSPNGRYASFSGTSMATPHVTGAAALYAASHPGATAQQIKTAILTSVSPTASLAGRTLTGGRLNVAGF
jgi:subtilisin family serine protease